MALPSNLVNDIVSKVQINENDTGSTKVQIALATTRITHLTAHMQTHPKDLHSRRGLLTIVNRRRKLLNYLKRTDDQGYRELIEMLGLRK
jgi:small subunit ribosomal protein S15